MGRFAQFWQWLIIGAKLIDHPSQIVADEVFRLSVFALFTVALLWSVAKVVKSRKVKHNDRSSYY